LHDTNEISSHEPELFNSKGLRSEQEAAPIISTDRTFFFV